MKYITKKNLLFFFLTCLSIICIYLLRYSTGSSGSQTYQLGTLRITRSAISGIISGINALIYVLLVFTDYKKGIIVSLSLTAVSFINIIISIILSHSIGALPGIITNTVSCITLVTIYSFYKKLSISNLTDFITGQHNRRSYVYEINRKVSEKKSFTLACIEIEDFKHINDVYGIQTGDYLLKITAEKLHSILNKNDILFRITGSTFAILFEPGESPEERLKAVIPPSTVSIPHKSDENDDIEINCTLSLIAGIVYSHPPYNSTKDASSILHDAETALSAARNMGNKKLCIFDENMDNSEVKQRAAEFLVKEALEKNYFYLTYQPQYTSKEHKLRGFETLIRCRKPDGSIVIPGVFIPVAEKSNLILKIDDFVLRNAMKEFKPLLDKSDKELTIAVNISAKNIGSKDFATRVKKIIEETQFPPENLELEITEYSFAESRNTTIENIKALKKLGIQIALDDFGTGYTSIAQLMKLPINLLKIDKSLIDDIESNQNMRDLIDSVIYMGHIMNCEVISEGVENESQIDLLKEHKCDFIQGYVWGKPQSIAEAEVIIEE